jgi:spore germination protein YaaH
MRDNYVEIIKEFIRKKSEYKNTLDLIKKDVTMMGGTEQEFEEAIKELEDENAKKRKLPKLSKKNTLISLGVFFFSIFYVSLIYSLIFTPPKNVALTNENLAKNQAFEHNPFPVVYASTREVDANKVFSVPPSEKQNIVVPGRPKKEVLGFFPYWMLDKHKEVSVSYLTSVSLFGLTVTGRGEIAKVTGEGNDPGWVMWTDGRLDDFIQKAKKSRVKVYLTFKSFNNDDIETISKNASYQDAFISNALFLVNSKNLDGINIDFEYIGDPDEATRNGFTQLITKLNQELKRQIPDSNLSIDTYLVSGGRFDLFDIQTLAENLDHFVIMGYDMHTPNGGAGPVAAMGGETNVITYVQNYLEKVGPEKLILAVPYYGYDWPDDKSSGASVKILPYAQIAEVSKSNKINWNELSQTPFYSYNEEGVSRIVHFDNVRSLGIKYDFINREGLAGVGIWALGYDGYNLDLEKLIIDKFITQ